MIAARIPFIRKPVPGEYRQSHLEGEFAAVQRAVPPSKVTDVAAAYTAKADDHVILADATSGAFAVTLPVASRALRMEVTVKRVNGGGNAVTIARSGADTIDGAASVSLGSQYASRTLISDGSVWHIIASV